MPPRSSLRPLWAQICPNGCGFRAHLYFHSMPWTFTLRLTHRQSPRPPNFLSIHSLPVTINRPILPSSPNSFIHKTLCTYYVLTLR